LFGHCFRPTGTMRTIQMLNETRDFVEWINYS